ncbi:MAG: VanZ family protein [Clostridium sp.]
MAFKLNKKIIFEGLFYLLFIVYILVLLKVVMFKYIPVSQVILGNTFGMFRSANFIPFDSIVSCFNGEGGDAFRALLNLLGNIAVFAPLGYCTALIFKQFNRLWKIGILSFVISSIFEVLQYTLYIGSLDVDDIILNTLGGILGYGVYILVSRLISSREVLVKVSIVLSLIVFVAGYGVAKYEFADVLGISDHETLTIGEEDIPKRKPDFIGTYIGGKDGVISLYTGRTYKGSSEEKLMDKARVKVTKDTKILFMEISEDKKTTTVKYKPITINELEGIESYSNINLWKNGEVAEVVVLSKGAEKPLDNSNTVVDNFNTISGFLNSVEGNSVNINLISTMDNGNGTSIATSGNGEYANNKSIKIKNGAKIILKTITKSGKVLSEKEISINELKKEDSLEIKGSHGEEGFTGVSVVAYRTEK